MLHYLSLTDDLIIFNDLTSRQEPLVKAHPKIGSRIRTTSFKLDEPHHKLASFFESFLTPKANAEPNPQEILKQVTGALDTVEHLQQSEPSTKEEPKRPIDIFIPYAHKDQRLLTTIEKRLRILVRQGWNIAWVNSEVAIDMQWKDKKQDDLERYDLILLLVTPEFIETEYCYSQQLIHAVERHKSNAYVLPIIFYASVLPLNRTPFGKLPKTPGGGKAVNEWPKSDLAYRSITEDILKVLEDLQDRL